MNRSWMNWIPAACLAAMLAASGGCHCCPCLKKDNDCVSCPTSPYGTVNEEEKGKCKSRMNAMLDSWINADGCNPDEERIPILKRIADKANQQSEIEVIKTAAKIKHEEDMCQQKIKAVKYLGTVGCGCYDKDNQVAEALLAALSDCLPAVRLTAVQAIGGCVCDQPVPRLCCTPEIAERLAEMAWGYEDNGNCKEPVAEIRQWAAYVAQMCPKKPEPPEPVNKMLEDPIPDPTVEGIDTSKTEGSDDAPTETTPPPKPMDKSTPPDDDQSTLKQVPGQRTSDTPQRVKKIAAASWENRMVANLRSPDAGMRLATVELIAKAAQDGHTFRNERPDVNGDTTLNTLKDMGFGVDQDGNAIETDPTIRQTAADAFLMMDPAGLAAADSDDSSVMATANTLVVEEPQEVEFESPLVVIPPTPQPSAFVAAPAEPVWNAPVERQTPVAAAPRPIPAAAPQALSQPVVAARPAVPPAAALDGVVDSVDVAGETAIIRVSQSVTPARHARVLVRHRYILGRIQTIGEFEITDVAPGLATIRPVAGTSIRKISTGDSATVLGN